MNRESHVVSLLGHTFDLSQLASTQVKAGSVALGFRNGDAISLPWRDPIEREYILRLLQIEPGAS